MLLLVVAAAAVNHENFYSILKGHLGMSLFLFTGSYPTDLNQLMKYFTPEEANDLLPTLQPLMKEVLNRRARVSHAAQQEQTLLADFQSNIGNEATSTMVRDFVAIETLLEEIRSYGCAVKDINAGLLDFLSDRNGRDVFLCWKYGEPEVSHYHELHTGFQGRQPI